jgi:hypothetical protein
VNLGAAWDEAKIHPLAVVLEGQEEGEVKHTLMGVYERVEDKEVNGRGVWQALGGVDHFLYYFSSEKEYMATSRENMEAGNGSCLMDVKSTAATPDQIIEQWEVFGGTAWHKAPKLRVRVCRSVEKYAAEQRVEEEQVQALDQACRSRMLVVEGLEDDIACLMGVYELMVEKVVNRRAVWQKQDGGQGQKRFLYYSSSNRWYFSNREEMEIGSSAGFMNLISAALTPDQSCPSEVWTVDDGTDWVASPEVQVRRQ